MPTTCLATLAYNEHDCIVNTIESARSAGCDKFFVLDTGSTDDTFALANSAGATVVYHNLQASNSGSVLRNRLFELARQQDTDYIFWLDAGDLIEGKLPKRPEHAAYNIFVHMDEYRFHRVHLLRSDLDCRWDGMPRHEDLDILEAPLWEGCVVNEAPHRPQNRGGAEHDLKCLLEYLDQHPDSTRAVFYIARSHLGNNDVPQAIEWFTKRAQLGGPIDEVWFSWYTIANICEPLSSTFWHAINACISILPDRMETHHLLAKKQSDAGHFALAMIAARVGLSFADRPQLGTLQDKYVKHRLESEFNRSATADRQQKES
jgi:glycosyltransferase involved in cell wall biosynthesis